MRISGSYRRLRRDDACGESPFEVCGAYGVAVVARLGRMRPRPGAWRLAPAPATGGSSFPSVRRLLPLRAVESAELVDSLRAFPLSRRERVAVRGHVAGAAMIIAARDGCRCTELCCGDSCPARPDAASTGRMEACSSSRNGRLLLPSGQETPPVAGGWISRAQEWKPPVLGTPRGRRSLAALRMTRQGRLRFHLG